jgi:hypothetical protein
MDDAGEEGGVRIDPRDPARDDLAQCRDMGRVFPQAHRQLRCSPVPRHAFHLPHHNGGGQHPQGIEADARNGALDVGDAASGAVVDHRIGHRHDARREQRIGLHQFAPSWSSEASGSSRARCTFSAISVVVGKIRSSPLAVSAIRVSIALVHGCRPETFNGLV